MNLRAARRKAAALLNGALISIAGAKLVPAKPKSVWVKRVRASGSETLMLVSKEDRKAQVRVRTGTPDWMTFDQIFIDEDYDLRRLARFDELCQQYDAIRGAGHTPLIIDLGANVGFSAVYFYLAWPAARIVAVEPDPANLEQLRRNVEELSAIEIVPAAIASHGGELQIKDPSAEANAVRVVEPGEGRGASVPAVTIPQILERLQREGCRPFIVKADIEGAEADLFSANVEWIDAVPLLIVELHDWLYPRERTSRSFLSAIAARDRDFVYLDENVFSIRNGDDRP
ncbi:MAG: FkbM family methyltransferase [Sphingomicrobium sp.]